MQSARTALAYLSLRPIRPAGERGHAEAQRHLRANLELGAEVVRVASKVPVQGLIDFARSHGVGLIFVGRSHQAKWKQFFGLTADLRLVRDAEGIDVQVVSFDESPGNSAT